MTHLEASFFALKTHLELITFAPRGGSSRCQVPAAFSVAISSLMACSYYTHSGWWQASPKVCSSRASASTVLVIRICSRSLQSSSRPRMLSLAQALPIRLSTLSFLVKLPGMAMPHRMAGSDGCMDEMPTLD
jgi:hypothetical protein